MLPPLPNLSPQRILIIKPSAIGDVVHALPVLNLLRRKWSAAKISWLVTPACAGLLEGHPLLDEVILFDRKRWGGMWKSPTLAKEWFRFTRELRDRRFDLVIDLQGLFRSGWLAWKTRAPVRVGFANARELAPAFYTHRVPIDTPEQHAISRYLALAKFIGCDDGPAEFPMGTTDADRAHVHDLLSNAGLGTEGSGLARYAVLLPGTNWETKRWPVEKFAGMVEPLRTQFGLASVLAGGPDAGAMAPQIPGAVNLTCKTTLRQLAALLERADLVVANDSGPMHVAVALGRPLVTPFGPTNPVRTGPYGRMDSVVRLDIACSPCYSRTCSHQSCMRFLEVDRVLGQAAEQMAKPPASASNAG